MPISSNRRNLVLRAFIVAAATMFPMASFAATIVSTFDSDADGWTGIPNEGAVAFVASGGNPGGHIRVTDIGTGGPLGSGAVAPAKFLGDLSALKDGTLSLDMATFGGSLGGTFPIFGTVRILGGGDSALFDLATTAPPLNVWQMFSAPLTAAAWGKTDAEWMAILASVTEIAISTDAFNGGDIIGIDNFQLASPSQTVSVPLPGSGGLFLVGLAGLAASMRGGRQH